MMCFRPLTFVVVLLCGLSYAACSKPSASSGNREPHAREQARKHEHRPPHGGTAVVLGDELYHLELVFDPSGGRLQAYVLDGELENFVRCPAPSLTLRVFSGAGVQSLELMPVANVATGETAGDTALFEGKADWLKGRTSFDAELAEIVIRGTRFAEVKFNFPKGNEDE